MLITFWIFLPFQKYLNFHSNWNGQINFINVKGFIMFKTTLMQKMPVLKSYCKSWDAVLSITFMFWKVQYSDENKTRFHSGQIDDLRMIFRFFYYADKLLHVSSTHTEWISQPENSLCILLLKPLYCQIQEFCQCVIGT